MTNHRLSLNAMENLLRDAGAERVGHKAKEALRDYLESEAVDIGTLCVKFSKHAGRKTVKEEDVQSALNIQ